MTSEIKKLIRSLNWIIDHVTAEPDYGFERYYSDNREAYRLHRQGVDRLVKRLKKTGDPQAKKAARKALERIKAHELRNGVERYVDAEDS